MEAGKKRKNEENVAESSHNQLSKMIPLEELEDALECPVCLTAITDSPIYVCEILHLLCHQCRDSLIKKKFPCPVCGGKLTDKRCHVVEKIVQKLPKVCCKFEGCTFQKTNEEFVLKHEQNCSRRLIPCPYCDIDTAINSCVEHYKSVHDSKVTKFRLGVAKRYQTMNLHKIIEIEDDSPHPHFKMNSMCLEEGTFFFWISCIGPKNLSKAYKFTLQVSSRQASEDNKDFIFEGTRRCVPFDISNDEMKATKLCLMLGLDEIKEIAIGNDEAFFGIRLTIRRA